jgi:hypothetical protein
MCLLVANWWDFMSIVLEAMAQLANVSTFNTEPFSCSRRGNPEMLSTP